MCSSDLHFHDTFGNALANVRESLKHGIAVFDSSAGGIGGCPYAPGAKGNVSTSELVSLLESLGIDTGVDQEKLEVATQFIQNHLLELQKVW